MAPRDSRTVADLIDAFGGNTALARIIGTGPTTVSEMKRKRSVHVRHWPVIIKAAEKAGIDWVTPDALMRMHADEAEAVR